MSKILKYNEAKFKIIQLILDSGIVSGGKLPPEKQLVETLGLGLVPVRHALAELAELGVIRKVHGVGSFLCRDMKAEEQPRTRLGIVSVDSVNEVGVPIHRAMEERNGTHETFLVGGPPSQRIIERMKRCDHFIITGHVNALWTNVVKSLGKPVIQAGTSPAPGEIARVDFNMRKALARGMAYLKKRGTVRAALVTGAFSFLSYSRELTDVFLSEGEKAGLRVTTRDVFLPDPRTGEFASMLEYAESARGEYDVIFVEFSVLWTFLMHFWNEPHLRSKKFVLLEFSQKLTQDFENLNSWGVVNFPENIFTAAVRILYESPASFTENNETYYIEPEFTGPVWNEPDGKTVSVSSNIFTTSHSS